MHGNFQNWFLTASDNFCQLTGPQFGLGRILMLAL